MFHTRTLARIHSRDTIYPYCELRVSYQVILILAVYSGVSVTSTVRPGKTVLFRYLVPGICFEFFIPIFLQKTFATSFRAAVPFWGQTTQIVSNLSPNGTAVLKGLGLGGGRQLETAVILAVFREYILRVLAMLPGSILWMLLS